MDNIEYCQVIEKEILSKLGVRVSVIYGECDMLGKWFYIKRNLYGGFYRLGMFVGSSISYIQSLKELPSDAFICK